MDSVRNSVFLGDDGGSRVVLGDLGCCLASQLRLRVFVFPERGWGGVDGAFVAWGFAKD